MRRLLLLLIMMVLLTSCSYQDCHTVEGVNQDNITVEEALQRYNRHCADKYTRSSIDERLPFVLGDAEWRWDDAECSSYEDKSAVDIPLSGGYQYMVYRKQADGTYYGVHTVSRVVAVQNDTTGNISFYIRVSIPNREDNNASTESLNYGDRTNFSGLEYYITIDGCPAAIVKFENGEQTDGVFLGDESIDKVTRIRKLADLLRGVCIGRNFGNTRNDPEMKYGQPGETFQDQWGSLYVYQDILGNDGISDVVTQIFPDDIAYTIHFGTAAGGDSAGGSSGSSFTGPTAGSSTTGLGGLNSGNSGGAGVGGSINQSGDTTNHEGKDKDGQTPTNGEKSKDDNNQSKGTEDVFHDWSTNLINPDGSISVNPIEDTNKIGTDTTPGVNITKLKVNVNLGDRNKFVGYNNPKCITNCLDICKMILSNYGIINYGSPNNVFKLMHEVDGVLKHYGDNVQQNYQNAIDCIDQHLDAGRPIIVGVNHSPNNGINEGTTDHFVVIYGRNYNIETGYYHYLYYEVARSNIDSGYNDSLNNFIYSPSDPPYFYDEISNRRDKKRYDVIQVRPNDGNIEGTIPQFTK